MPAPLTKKTWTLRRQRLIFVTLGAVACCAAVLLVLSVFRENIVFFFMPSEIAAAAPQGNFRLGGLVEQGSVQRIEGGAVRFRVTDGTAEISVRYAGLLPNLFREGQGVVAEGELRDGEFIATRVLAKHDENYMPREVAEKLKREGVWREGKEGE